MIWRFTSKTGTRNGAACEPISTRNLDILRKPLHGVKGRLIGLYGGRDAIALGHLHERKAYLSAIQPDSVFREIDGAGHWACYEAAEAFNQTYLEILQAVDR